MTILEHVKSTIIRTVALINYTATVRLTVRSGTSPMLGRWDAAVALIAAGRSLHGGCFPIGRDRGMSLEDVFFRRERAAGRT